MVQSGSIRAGRAFVEVSADDSKLVRGLKRAEQRLAAFGGAIRNIGLKLAGVGTIAGTALFGATKAFASMGDAVAKMSARTGVSAEALSTLAFAAEQSGSGLDALENGLRRMQATLYDAGRGLSTANTALADLGLTFDALKGLTPEQQFKLIAEQLADVSDPTLRAALAMRVFGRAGTQLLPMMAAGARGIEQFQAEARRLGLQMSGEDAKAAERFTDAMNRLWRVIKMGVFRIGAALAPVFQRFVDQATAVIAVVGQWIGQNRNLIVTALWIAAAVTAAGVALVGGGTAVKLLAAGLGMLGTVVTAVGVAFKVFGAVLAFLVSPIGMVITAVALLGAWMLHATGAGAKALGWLGEKWGVLKEDANTAVDGIKDALVAGDIGAAAKVLWTFLKLQWQRGVGWLSSIWTSGLNWLTKVFTEAWSGLQVIFHAVVYGIQSAWDWLTTGLFNAASWLWDKLRAGWTHLTSGIASAWTWLMNKVGQKSDEEAAAEYKRIENEKNAKLNAVKAEGDAWRKEREEQLKQRQAARDKEFSDTISVIVDEQTRRERALDAEQAAKEKANADAAAAARREFDEAVAAAKKARKEKEDRGPDKMGEPEFDPKKMLADVQAGLAGLNDLADKATVRGTFNAAAIQSLAGGTAADRTAKATEETAKNTKKIVQRMDDDDTFD